MLSHLPTPAPPTGALRQLQVVRAQQQLGMFSSPNQEIALLSKKWRTERNLWYEP